jgi:MHS family proline/betaine transporter-like MFS transporter
MVRYRRLRVFRGLYLEGFLPDSDPTISLLLTLGTFALSFLTRPLGGVILGIYADRQGRRASLMI